MGLKIALIMEATHGGTARHLVELAGGLVDGGHSVHVIYSRARVEPRFEAGLARLPGLKTAVVEMRRVPHPSDAFAAAAISQYLKRYGPFDIVHGHSSKGGALARLAAFGLPGARVYTPHCFRTLDPALSMPGRTIYGMAERVLSYLSHAIIAVSPDEVEHAVRLGIPRRKLHLVFNGVGEPDLSERPVLRAQLGLADEEICVGFLARYVPQKAPQRMVEVVARLNPALPPFRIAMVGGGPLEPTLRAQVAAAGVADRFTFVSGAIGPKVICAFDIFALPSAYEGMPYVLLEAAAAGLPTLATAVGGSTSVINHGRNGFVVSNWDAQDFATQLSHMIQNAQLRSEMGRESRKIGKSFTVERMVRETIDVYRIAIERQARLRAAHGVAERGPSARPGAPHS